MDLGAKFNALPQYSNLQFTFNANAKHIRNSISNLFRVLSSAQWLTAKFLKNANEAIDFFSMGFVAKIPGLEIHIRVEMCFADAMNSQYLMSLSQRKKREKSEWIYVSEERKHLWFCRMYETLML